MYVLSISYMSSQGYILLYFVPLLQPPMENPCSIPLKSSTPHKRRVNGRKSFKRKSFAVKDHNDNVNWREIPQAISSESIGTTTTTDDTNSTLKKSLKPLPLTYLINQNRRQSSLYVKSRKTKYLTSARDHRRKKSKQQRFENFNEARCSIYRKHLKKSQFNNEEIKNDIENIECVNPDDKNTIKIEETFHPISYSSFENIPSTDGDDDTENASVKFEKLAKLKISESPFLDDSSQPSTQKSYDLVAKQQKSHHNQKSRSSLHPGSVIMNRKIPQLNFTTGYFTKNISVDKSNLSSNASSLSSFLKSNNYWSNVWSYVTITHLNIFVMTLIIIISIYVLLTKYFIL